MEQTYVPHAELLTVKRFREDAERQARAFQPFIEQQLEVARTFARTMEPMLQAVARIQQQLAPFLEDMARARASLESLHAAVKMPSFDGQEMSIAVSSPRYARIHPDDQEYLVERMVIAVERRIPIPKQAQVIETQKRIVAMPPGATWDDGKTKLKMESDRTLSVFYSGELVRNYDYEELGFARKNTKPALPDRQWEMLEKLSMADLYGGAFKPTVASLAEEMRMSPSACQQIKCSLAKKLKAAFGMPGQPFRKYDPTEGYRLKASLEPIGLLRGGGELYRPGGSLHDNGI